MKLTYIKSATVVIEHNGIKVLCDPWLKDGIYYGSWYHYPPLKFTPADFQDVNYIYLSHIHPDHADIGSLKEFRKDIPIIICEYREKFLKNNLTKLGFTNIIELGNREEYLLGQDFKMEMMAGDDCNAEVFAAIYGCSKPENYTVTRQIDSLAIFNGGGKTIVNTNDVPAAMIFSSLDYIREKYSPIDVLLVSYAGAGPYPQACDMSEDEMLDKAVFVAHNFLRGTVAYIGRLRPRIYIPFAGQYTLGGRLWDKNRYKGTLELDELRDELPPALGYLKIKSGMLLLNSGGFYDLQNEMVGNPFTPTNFTDKHHYIRDVLSKKKFPYEEEFFCKDQPDLMPNFERARARLLEKQKDYQYFSDWIMYLDVGNGERYAVPFDGGPVYRAKRLDLDRPFVTAKMDYSLMKMILDRKAHWNNAEVGSHIILGAHNPKPKEGTYRAYEPSVHYLMSYFQDLPPAAT